MNRALAQHIFKRDKKRMNQRLQIIFPNKLIFGNGSLSQLADEVLQLKPAKVFIATIVPLKESIASFVTTLKKNNVFSSNHFKFHLPRS